MCGAAGLLDCCYWVALGESRGLDGVCMLAGGCIDMQTRLGAALLACELSDLMLQLQEPFGTSVNLHIRQCTATDWRGMGRCCVSCCAIFCGCTVTLSSPFRPGFFLMGILDWPCCRPQPGSVVPAVALCVCQPCMHKAAPLPSCTVASGMCVPLPSRTPYRGLRACSA